MSDMQLNTNELSRYIEDLKRIESSFVSESEKIRASVSRAGGWEDEGYTNVLIALNEIFKEINVVLDSIHSTIKSCENVAMIANSYSSYS